MKNKKNKNGNVKMENSKMNNFEKNGIEWYNNLNREQRKYWLEQTKTYKPVDAYKKYLNSEEQNERFISDETHIPRPK